MPIMATWSALLFSGALLVGAGCNKDSGGGGAAPGSGSASAKPASAPAEVGGQRDGVEGLKAFILGIRDACAAKDFAKGKAMVLGAIPTRADIESVLVETAPLEAIEKLETFYKQMPPDDERAACLFSLDPSRTIVSVYASTVEQLIAYEDGTAAYKEFPDGAKDVAESLRPGRTFYEVEVTAPGLEEGTKFHMFFWDGKRWRMLGPLWRAFQ
jgi:hypothetical protein